jgi:hypothetical protein
VRGGLGARLWPTLATQHLFLGFNNKNKTRRIPTSPLSRTETLRALCASANSYNYFTVDADPL